MARPIVASYGSWKSPITADIVAGGEVALEQLRIDGDDIYWIERRAQEGGRKVIVRRSSDGRVTDVTPVGFNARTRVHEYGGGDYAVSNGTIVFSNFADQRLYVQEMGSEPKPLTPEAPLRFADLSAGSLYDLLERSGVRLSRVTEEVHPVSLRGEEAKPFGLPAGAPAFAVERIALAGERSVEHRLVLAPGDRVTLTASWGNLG